MPFSAKPFAEKKFLEINGYRMAYIDEGEGDAIVFQHGNPTSSYLWRNIMPYCKGMGRLIACDLIGMGDSAKLQPSGPDRYTYAEQRSFIHALWDALDLGDRVVMVLHDWGSALGLEWASKHRDRIQGLAYMEGFSMPLAWSDFPEALHKVFGGFRSPAGEEMVLEKNVFVERVLTGSIMRKLSDEEMTHYRKPFLNPGEDRRPTLSWPRQIPLDGEPADVAAVVAAFGAWLATSPIPKLFVNAEPGAILTGRPREVCRTWPNQTEITVKGSHFIQEDSPDEIGAALAAFVKKLRAP
jgi:haloalkane dehalogenase